MPPLFAAELLSTEFVVTVGLLILTLLAGAIVLQITTRWRDRQLAPNQESAQTLSDFRTLFERGEISEGEYAAIRAKMAAQIKHEINVEKAGGLAATPAAPSQVNGAGHAAAPANPLDPPAPV